MNNHHINYLLIITLIFVRLSLSYYIANLTDLKRCKLSHLGLEYSGDISKTEGDVRCQSWTANKPVHKIDSTITDEMFPERSKLLAKSYCRNPKRKPDGPWCYSMDPELIDDTCGIPLCSFFACKLTGPGMEYGGQHKKSVSDKKCLKWDKSRNKVQDVNGEVYKQEKFSKRQFPDETRGDAKNFCRNPDGDLGGPWCFVDSEKGKGIVEKHYCDIPFGHEENCVTLTKHSKYYSHFTVFNESLANLTFGLKLWNPDDELNNDLAASILLSLFAVPLTDEQFDNLQIAIEIKITNKRSAMTIGNKNKNDFEPTIGVLKSSKFTYFSLTWGGGFINLNLEGNPKPIFLAEYRAKKGLFKENRDKFFYYSLKGENLLWSLPFCDDDDECEIHRTTSNNFERFYPLFKGNTSHDLRFYVRGFHSVCLKLTTSPTINFPYILVTLEQKSDNTTRILLHENKKASLIELKSVTILKLLNYWEWRYFTMTLFGGTLQLYWERDVGTQLIAEVNHEIISRMRWFSPGSDDSIAEWTFYCSVVELKPPPKPWLPECILNTDEVDYKGTQSVTRNGQPCIPWTYDSGTKAQIGETEVIKFWNYCRDPFNEKKGTYCYVVNQKPDYSIKKSKCSLRMCRSSECRMAGTGNDYIGKINTTRSNRTCQRWTTNSPHTIPQSLLNDTLYADQNVTLAENFCRDPSRNIAGPWCYTTDSKVEWDICNVKDCDHNEECIIMTRGRGEGRLIYILPEWKEAGLGGGLHFALKEWDPDKLDGIIFDLFPLDNKPGFLRLVIGAENNEKIIVYYSDTTSENAYVAKEKSLPHLIPAGKWGAFWLQMRKGEIALGYEGSSEPLFTWEHENKDSCFEPGFMTYMSIQNFIIGVHFKCTECHTERTNTEVITRIMPIGLWSTTEHDLYKNLSFYVRGNGSMLIPLLLMPRSGDYFAITIGEYKSFIFLVKKQTKSTDLIFYYNLKQPAFHIKNWTNYIISFDEKSITVYKDNTQKFKYETKNETFLFYWFTVITDVGYVEWSANCIPPDIDGAPRDGGWSDWSPYKCSVSCGGGTGIRYRTCSNPKPNIRGNLCRGPYSNTGTCNNFECGDVSPDTLDKIRQNLKTKHFSLIVKEGDRIVIENDSKMLKLVQKESPKSSYQWTLNGAFIKEIPKQIEFINDNIIISNASRKQNAGIYACVLYRIKGQRVILRIITVAIKSKNYDLITRATRKTTLVCNAAILAYVYTDLSQSWLLNGTTFFDYGITTLAAVITEKIESLNVSHSGTWTCRVTQNDLKLAWTITIMRIKVKTAPNFATNLMEDKFTSYIFGRIENEAAVITVFIVIIIVIFGLVFLGLFLYLKYGTLPKRQYKYRQLIKK